jgi:DNA-binding MarR family transcriptional regulator
MSSTYWEAVGYVKRSKNRINAMELLTNPLMPSEVGKMMQISLTHASKIVRELNSKKLIHCLNENLKVGRIYQLTAQGKKVLQAIKKQ